MQLVAMGAQDVFLTGNPQITFFKVVYRRHTNFSKECIKQEFNGSGASLTCTLSRNGDLVQEIYLHGTSLKDHKNDVTNQVVKTVEVEIGGQKIDKHYGTWLDIYNELFETNHDYQAAMSDGGTNQEQPEVFIPLRFWFNRNPGLALPLIALQYHEVKVLVEMTSGTALGNPDLLVNYVYLDTDERRRFAQVSHEYLIEQVQHTGTESVGASGGSVTLTYNHPVKALFWRGFGTNATYNAKLQLNGHDRFTEQTNRYFHLVQPYECGLGHSKALVGTDNAWDTMTGSPVQAGMYSFCLKPGEHQPSGSCNFSRIDNARLVISGSPGATSLEIFALNYNVLRVMSGMGGLTYSN